jgi:hypothetical protein
MSMYDDQDAGPASRKKKARSWTCLTIVFAGGFAVLLICCGGGAGIVWFGMNVLSAEIENQLRDNELVKEHIGVIESLQMDFSRSVAEGGGDAMVFKVKGSLGEGHVTVVTDTVNGTEQVVSATLRKSDGTEVQLVP